MRNNMYNILAAICHMYIRLDFSLNRTMSFRRGTRYIVNQSEATFLSPIKCPCVAIVCSRFQRDSFGSLRLRPGRSRFLFVGGDARDRENRKNWSMDRGIEEEARGDLWYFASSCFDQWCFKAYKSAAAVGQLRFIVDFKRKCLPYAFRTNTESRGWTSPRRSLDPAWNLYLESLERAFLPRSIDPRVCGNSLHESTRTRLKLRHLSRAITTSWRVEMSLNFMWQHHSNRKDIL